MRPTCALLASLWILATIPGLTARQQAIPAAASVAYSLTARLDPINRAIFGRGRLRWRNTAGIPATELRLATVWNAWRDPSSSWMRDEALGSSRSRLFASNGQNLGFVDVTAIALAGPSSGSQDLLPRARYIAPDDRNGSDQTVLAVTLPEPVAPGGTVDVDFAWNADLPRLVDGIGALGNYFLLAHWFPEVGRFTAAGWTCHQFRQAGPSSCGDRATFDITLTVPRDWTIGAGGVEQPANDNEDGTVTRRYVANDVSSFAWAASPDFIERRERFDTSGAPAVDIRLLMQPEHAPFAARYFAAARAALHARAQASPYPYRLLTIVDPPGVFNTHAQGTSAALQAYPGLVVGASRWMTLIKDGSLERSVIEGVLAQDPPASDPLAGARIQAAAYPNKFVTVGRYFGGLVPWPYEDAPWSVELDAARVRSGPGQAQFDYAVGQVSSLSINTIAAGAVAGAGGSFDHRIIVARLGHAVSPVDVRTTFRDQSEIVERWDGQDPTHLLRYQRGSPIDTIEIDPDRTVPDVNRVNNSYTTRSRAAETPTKWALRWLTWLEQVMLTYAFFA